MKPLVSTTARMGRQEETCPQISSPFILGEGQKNWALQKIPCLWGQNTSFCVLYSCTGAKTTEEAEIGGRKGPAGFGDECFEVEWGGCMVGGGAQGHKLFLGCSRTGLELTTNVEHLPGQTSPSTSKTRRLVSRTGTDGQGAGLREAVVSVHGW